MVHSGGQNIMSCKADISVLLASKGQGGVLTFNQEAEHYLCRYRGFGEIWSFRAP